jgi:hypothetical protein
MKDGHSVTASGAIGPAVLPAPNPHLSLHPPAALLPFVPWRGGPQRSYHVPLKHNGVWTRSDPTWTFSYEALLVVGPKGISDTHVVRGADGCVLDLPFGCEGA